MALTIDSAPKTQQTPTLVDGILASPQFWSAIVTAIVAAVVALIVARVNKKTLENQQKIATKQRETDFRRQQLNEFYGKAYMLEELVKVSEKSSLSRYPTAAAGLS